ncbi:MAG: NnrS family protein, partial [Acidobacteriota bacterium]
MSTPFRRVKEAASGGASLRQEPYRLFFPLGILLAWGGILHWLLHAMGLLEDYRPVFHSIVQIQGFLTCFAVGFLFTALPRRAGAAPAAVWHLAAGALLPGAVSVAAWFQHWALSQFFWLGEVAVLISFAIACFRSRTGTSPLPSSFIWLPLSFAMGVAGSLMTGSLGVLGPAHYRVHDLGRLLLLQGLFIGLVLGVGGMVLPLITQGPQPRTSSHPGRNRRARQGHLLGALLLCGSFVVENFASLRGGLAFRALLLAVLLVAGARMDRWPALPGMHRRLVWLSAWMIPAGYLLAALFPAQKKAGLHLVFIGGFALLALSVGVHVVLAHGGYRRLLSGRPWQVPVYGGFLL